MDKEEIISQGYLESYITGDLNNEETREVEELIASDKEAMLEFYNIQKLIELLAIRLGISASPVIKRTIMEHPSVSSHIKPIDKGSSGGWRMAMAASILFALFTSVLAAYFYSQWRTTDNELTSLIAQNLQLAESFNRVNNDLNNLRQDVAVLISPEYQRIIMDGTENAPDVKAVIYWNSKQEKVFLNSSTLASLPTDQQYQLWALVDGQPIDAGVFDASTGTFQIMKNIAKADAFAVTVEPKGGSESPTLSTMQVLGKV
ncbi:anti-sigma factor [Marinoscillum sp. MHG1-6]|uniref:anti-sigma factor n=1 Tax=Marinoscillum sp. MHG1-6 TaxID=2959627 RepID=UPI0021576DAC|nr:anti-sigma factor [Marinoscillum sp. MHG1-6]